MAESADSLFRRGMISEKQAGRLGVFRDQKDQPTKMAAFDEKGGKRDQGGVKDRGDKVAAKGHINDKRTTRAGSPIAGKPSKSGQAGREDQFDVDEIDDGENQKPDFPTQRGKGRKGSPPRQRGKVQPSGPAYGGPNSRADS